MTTLERALASPLPRRAARREPGSRPAAGYRKAVHSEAIPT
ncbi:hypothetical protein [Streptomyces sp. PT12]|nr:hypothetical protein [Streptomyces sp. PT12]